MTRSRHLALAALVVSFPLLASCAGMGTVARSSPSASAVAKGPATTSTSGGASNLSACVPGSHTEPLWSYSGFKMVGATTGWDIGQCALSARPSFPNGSTIQCYWPDAEFAGILRTQDGGRTWIDVSPPSLPNRSFQHSEFFLDAQHAWVGEVTRNADACVTAVTTFSTSDGGQTWHRGGVIAVKSESPTSGLFDVFGPADGMDFIDPLHGWMLLTSSAANPDPDSMSDPTSLYSTTDGGQHWKVVANNPGKSLLGAASGCPTAFYAPVSDAVFTSRTSGWFAIQCPPTTLVLRTEDGGASWSAKPLPCSCQVYVPKYFDAEHAVITGTQGSKAMLSTADGGATWAQHAVPAAAMTYFSFIDPNDGWMVGIEQLPRSYDTVIYRTTDGGQSWSQVGKPGFATSTSSPNLYFPIQALQFVDANTGFVMLGAEAGAQGSQGVTDPTAPQLQLLSTSDGGRSWTAVVRQIPAVTCSANYNNQLGFGNGPVWPEEMASSTVGWARGGFRTTDGGVHWREVSSPALREGASTPRYPTGYSDFYLDGNHAWQVGVYGSKTSCTDHVTTFATADGGKTWQKSSPIVLSLPAGYAPQNLQLGFTSAQTGWLWVPSGQSNQDPMSFRATEADVYSTSDGGATWQHVSRLGQPVLGPTPPSSDQNCQPGFGRIEYLSPTVGWLSPVCGDSPMLGTRDGGVTWKGATFPIPSSAGCPCYLQTMKFTDPSHGIVVFSGQSGLTGSTVVLSTSDGGSSWQSLPQPGTGFLLQLSFVNPNDLIALVTPPGWTKVSKGGLELYRSTDGGHTWAMVSSDVPATWPPGFMQFVDLNHGFESNINGADQFLATSDGGKTWRSITPAIVS